MSSTEPESDTRAFLTGWFRRLTESGFDGAVFAAGLADDIVWTATGHSPISGTCHGRAEYLERIYRPLAERLERWPRPEVLRIMVDGDWGLVEFSGVGGLGRNGTDYSMRYCWLMRVADGAVREVIGYYDQGKVAELFA
ncbi:nuclear transport factor 2 family protein [Nakamurella leprariae]|uniref:Nuclear transport factor 2 family protein n=1 Tax=Nakamurella leprariae TaxID=2803911 RepID=A0A939BYV5_9ACTN|nr:nuclear transport factor 2 family protein [Nakamurella leprariae]MBM9467485.1 nuclear transport factor 2 family protein [Nakamurella leprariae]